MEIPLRSLWKTHNWKSKKRSITKKEMKLSKAALRRLRKRAQIAMADPEEFFRFSISPETVLALLNSLERRKSIH